MVCHGLSLIFCILGNISRFRKDFTWAGPGKTWFGLQEVTQLNPFYFRNRPKRSQEFVFAIVFSHLDIWIVIYQPSMTLFKFNDFSNQCPQLAWGPEDLVPPPRRNEIYQIDPNWTKPTRVKHLLTGMIFSPFWFLELFGSLTSQSLLESPIGCKSWTRRMKGLWCPICSQGQGVIRCHKYSELWYFRSLGFLGTHVFLVRDVSRKFIAISAEVTPKGSSVWESLIQGCVLVKSPAYQSLLEHANALRSDLRRFPGSQNRHEDILEYDWK